MQREASFSHNLTWLRVLTKAIYCLGIWSDPVNDNHRSYEHWHVYIVAELSHDSPSTADTLSTTMSLPAGVYRISRWGSQEHGQILTIKDDHVTVLPPSEAPERDQEVIVAFWPACGLSLTNVCLQWRVKVAEGGRVAIQIPTNIFPSHSLSYEGEAEKGKRIILGPPADFLTCEWLIECAPQLPLPVPYLSVRHPNVSLHSSLTFSFMNWQYLSPWQRPHHCCVSPSNIFLPEVCYSHSTLTSQSDPSVARTWAFQPQFAERMDVWTHPSWVKWIFDSALVGSGFDL